MKSPSVPVFDIECSFDRALTPHDEPWIATWCCDDMEEPPFDRER